MNKIKYVLLDLSYFMVQRGHVFKDLSYNGKFTGIYYGVLKLVRSIVEHYPETTIEVCRDGLPLAKRKLYPAYKANRDEVSYKPSKDYSMIKNLQHMLVTYPNVRIWYEPEYEADDLIASLAFRDPKHSLVLSGDNDFLQLIAHGVQIAKSIKQGKFVLRTADYIYEKYKTTPEKLHIFRALQGDKSDNIQGAIHTAKLKKIMNLDKQELLNSLSASEYRDFKRNLTLMSLKVFNLNPIHHEPLNVKADSDLFNVFGLEKLRYDY